MGEESQEGGQAVVTQVIGVVLAGGAATRLPNKPLLPLRNGRPAVFSSIDLFRRSGIGDIVVVVPPLSVIPNVVGSEVSYAIQREPLGVPHAVSVAIDRDLPGDTYVAVSCCDNVYSEKSQVVTSRYATVADNLPPYKAASLSGYECGKYKERVFSGTYIAGWFCAEASAWLAARPNQRTVDWLNEQAIKPSVMNKDEQEDWWDIGTQDTYLRYWS